MVINVIHNPNASDAQERMDRFTKEMQRQNYPFTVWSCEIDQQSVVRSINKSHKKIVQWAMDNKMPSVIIAEDDCVFPNQDALQLWHVWAKNISADIFCAGNYAAAMQPFEEFMMINNYMLHHRCSIRKTSCITGLHCYRIYERFYHTFLNIPENEHIDTALGDLGEFYTIYPMVAIQKAGFSSNIGRVVDYNEMLKPEDVLR